MALRNWIAAISSKRFGAVQSQQRDICLQVPAGTIHGIIGENGAGKVHIDEYHLCFLWKAILGT